MSYETHFWGQFEIAPALPSDVVAELSSRIATDWGHAASQSISGRPDAPCHWEPAPDGRALRWDECAKFYDYERWLRVLIDEFFAPRGHVLNGSVRYSGEGDADEGIIRVEANRVMLAELPPTW